MRTALDHIGYRLAVHVAGTDPPPNEGTSGFPLSSGPTHFARTLPNKIGKPRRIPPAMRAALEAAQPYNGGDAANLATLENLNDCDKHRFPPLLAGAAEVLGLNLNLLHTPFFEGPYLGPLEDRAVVAHFAAGTDVNMELSYRFDVAFGNGYPGDGVYVAPFLRTTLDYICGTVLPSLAAFL